VARNLDEHFEHLNEVLKRHKNACLKLKPSKCDLIKDEILYLGHLVGKTGVKPNPREYYYTIQVNQCGLPLHSSKDELHAALEGGWRIT
jgi:hypothetical protein